MHGQPIINNHRRAYPQNVMYIKTPATELLSPVVWHCCHKSRPDKLLYKGRWNTCSGVAEEPCLWSASPSDIALRRGTLECIFLRSISTPFSVCALLPMLSPP